MNEIEDISREEFIDGVKGARFVPLMPQEISFPLSGGQIMVPFNEMNTCPKCKTSLEIVHVIQAVWPYPHGDIKLKCPECKDSSLFGVPVDPLFGMELIIWDSRPETILPQAACLEKPTCKFHQVQMKMTKIWGDLVMVDPENIRVQWKCPHSSTPNGLPTCYLTEHLTVPRKVKAETVADNKIRNRLRKLGYLE